MTFNVKVETSAGVALGDGPLDTVSRLAVTSRVDRASPITFDMPATDPASALFPDDTATYVRGRAFRDGAWLDVGRGIITSKTLGSESMTLRLSGLDLLHELTRTTVGTLALESAPGSGLPLAAASVLAAVMFGTLAGWTITGTPSKDVYYQFGDESHLAALIKLVDLTGDHFRLSRTVERQIEWLPTTAAGFDAAASGLRAVDVGDPDALAGNDDVCLIVGGLEEVTDDTQRMTRIYPRGGGNAEARLYLNPTTRFGAAGGNTGTFPGSGADADYALRITESRPDLSYIKHTALDTAGQIGVVETFRDIAPLDTSFDAELSAANELFDVALLTLKRRITAQKAYRVRVTKVRGDLVPGETIQVICRHFVDGYGWIDINEHLMMLEVSLTYGASDGEPVYDLQVTA